MSILTMLAQMMGISSSTFPIKIQSPARQLNLPRLLYGDIPSRPKRVYGCRHRIKKVNRLHLSRKAKARQKRRYQG